MKTTLSLAIAILICSCFSYAQIISFTGKGSKTGATVKIDSIQIQNLTQKRDTTLIGTNQIDLLVYTDVKEGIQLVTNQFSISQNYPNSFADETKFSVNLPYSSNLKILITNDLGQTIAGFNNYFESGNLQFLFKGASLPNGIYIISVDNGNDRKSIKIVKYGEIGAGENKIEYLGNGFTPAVFNPGDIYNFTGYAIKMKESKLNNIILVMDSNIVFQFEQLSPWNFSKIKMNIRISKVSLNTTFSDMEHGDFYSTTDTILDLSYQFVPGNNNFACYSLDNHLCLGWFVSFYDFGERIELDIDTSLKNFRNIQIFYCFETSSGYDHCYYKFSCTVPSMQFDKIDNKILAQLNLTESSGLIINGYGINYSHKGPDYKKNTFFQKIVSFDYDSYLKIELIP